MQFVLQNFVVTHISTHAIDKDLKSKKMRFCKKSNEDKKKLKFHNNYTQIKPIYFYYFIF